MDATQINQMAIINSLVENCEFDGNWTPPQKGAQTVNALAGLREHSNAPEYTIIDGLADLRHACDLLGMDFANLDRLAASHYRNERYDWIQANKRHLGNGGTSGVIPQPEAMDAAQRHEAEQERLLDDQQERIEDMSDLRRSWAENGWLHMNPRPNTHDQEERAAANREQFGIPDERNEHPEDAAEFDAAEAALNAQNEAGEQWTPEQIEAFMADHRANKGNR